MKGATQHWRLIKLLSAVQQSLYLRNVCSHWVWVVDAVGGTRQDKATASPSERQTVPLIWCRCLLPNTRKAFLTYRYA